MCIALYGKPIAKLWSVTCRMGTHSFTCHPTKVNVHHFNPRQTGRYAIHPPQRDETWKAELILVLARWFTKPKTSNHRILSTTCQRQDQQWNPRLFDHKADVLTLLTAMSPSSLTPFYSSMDSTTHCCAVVELLLLLHCVPKKTSPTFSTVT